VVLLLLLACDPLGPGAGIPGGWSPPPDEGQLRLGQNNLDFGTLSVLNDAPATMTVMVTNAGTGTLDVSGLTIVRGDTEAFRVDAPALVELAAGESISIGVTFQPNRDGLFEASVVPNGQSVLRFTGVATAPQARLLVDSDDLGVVPVGCSVQTSVILMNEGSELLLIDELRLEGTGDHSLSEVPALLEPGDVEVMELVLEPSAPGAAAATLRLDSNDPSGSLAIGVDALATSGGSVVEEFGFLPLASTDMLFVLDKHAASLGLFEEAEQQAQVLFEVFEEGGVDWRVSAVDGKDCHATYDPWLASGFYTPSQAGPALGLAFNANSIGIYPGTDALLDLTLAALQETLQGGCLEGFLRDEALLHVVLVGARTEASTAALSELVPFSDELVISAVMGEGTGVCEHAGAGLTAVEETGGVFWDICGGNWDGLYTQLAEKSWGFGTAPMRIDLAEDPAVNTLELRADSEVLSAWTWDGDAVLLDGDTEGLELWQPVQVSYELAQDCQ